MLGETINGYRIMARLGRGSMGEVWMAEQQIVNTIKVAIKFLLADWSSDHTVVQRFFDEARAVSQIKHAGIAKIHDVGYHRGLPYLIMDLLEGETLAARIAQHGPLAITRVGELGRQIASVLKATHAAGIIHRDLKPENIFLVRDDEPPGGERAIVLDFGIAKINSAVGGTGSGNAMGTPGYMAPELWTDASRADAYTDVYALGCIAFEMCCGRKPFLITGVPDAYHKHMFEIPPRMSTLLPGVPRELDAIIARALAKRPGDRPPMRELHQVFSAFAYRDDRWTGPALPPQAPPWRPTAPRSRLIAIGAGGLAGLAGIAGVLYATSGHTRASLIGPPAEAPVAPLANAWVRIPIPDDPVVLGLARDDERAAVRGFRPARRILSPAAPYELQEHEVTWSEIEPWLIASATRLVLPPWAADRAARRALPVTGATWSIARAYCESLGGSLPTEEQWELAARGAERRPNSWGSDRLDRKLTPVYAGTSAVPAPVMTSLQDRTPPPVVVYDLIGNVQEWTLGLWRTDQRSDDSWSTIGKSTTIRAIRGLPLGDDPPPSIQDETATYREELCATGPCVARTAAKLPLVGFRCARPAR